MFLGLRATYRVGKLDSIERNTSTLLVKALSFNKGHIYSKVIHSVVERKQKH